MRTGRPPKPEGERRNRLFRIRVNDAELEELEEAARSLGREASTWARELLLSRARSLKKRQREAETPEP